MISRNPKVSIIVTCYNFAPFIKEAVLSLINQDCDFEYEIILIDDCSTDGSLEKINEISSSKVKLLETSGIWVQLNQ